MKNRRRSAEKKGILWAAGLLALCFYVSAHYYQLMLIQGDSMSPAYHHLQFVMLDKRNRDFRPGDAVAFRCEGLGAVLVKRIAAAPGDAVCIRDGTLYVNGGASPLYPERAFDYAGLLEKERTLCGGEYIVIGDNINESRDSRHEQVGAVRSEAILGKLMG